MRFLGALDAHSSFVSVVSLGELHKGVAMKRRTDQIAADRLADWVVSLESMFADRLLPISAAVARRWGELSGVRALPVVDALIAATALTHGLTLVTRNTRDMEGTGVALMDPFSLTADDRETD